jgi:hypothetical protein
MSGDVFVIGNMAWNGVLSVVAVYWIRKWINAQERKADDTRQDIQLLRTEAESRSVRLHGRFDEMQRCITVVKTDVENKVDRDHCDSVGERRFQAVLRHEHTCCVGQNGKVIPL